MKNKVRHQITVLPVLALALISVMVGAASADVQRAVTYIPSVSEEDEVAARIPGSVVASARTLTVDLSVQGAAEALASMTNDLAGYTVMVDGFDVLTSQERRAEAAAVEAEVGREFVLTEQLCPPVPTGLRASNGTTTARLSCAPESGAITTRTFTGDTHDTLRAAMTAVLAGHIEVDSDDVAVREPRPGIFEVDVTGEIGDHLTMLDFSETSVLLTDILFTLYSNADIEYATMHLEGDCRAFALAVGGDMCGRFRLDDLPELNASDNQAEGS